MFKVNNKDTRTTPLAQLLAGLILEAEFGDDLKSTAWNEISDLKSNFR